MPEILKAVVLGVIEGLTEFLPVSSTGHMILAMPLLRIDPEQPPWHAFLYFIQIGAILAVVVYFGRSLWRQLVRWPTPVKTPSPAPATPPAAAPVARAGNVVVASREIPGARKPRSTGGLWKRFERTGLDQHMLVKLFVASLPAAAIGYPLHDTVEKYLEKPVPVAAALFLGAFVMEWIERRCRTTTEMPVERVSLRQAFLIGVAQCVSIIPGTSRAMATIMGGLLVGLPAATATEFSFYLAIPTLLGAGMLKVVKHRKELHSEQALLLGVGFITAFIIALLVVEGFMRFVRSRRLRPFAIYRVVLSIVVLVWWFKAAH